MIPKIRFLEFTGNWSQITLSNICTFHDPRRVPLNSDERELRQGKYPYYGASGVIDHIDDYIFDGEYVLLGEDGANILNRSTPLAFVISGKSWVNNHAHILEAKGSNKFLAESLERITYEKYNTGTAQPKLNAQVCKKIKLNYPKLEEEEIKIGAFLCAIDKKIEILKEKLLLINRYNKGVMLQLFSQNIRFKDSKNKVFPNWKEERVDYYVERDCRPVDVELNRTYREIGIRSHGKGVFHKDPIKGIELGDKKVYWVHPDAFVANIVFAWEHAVAKTSEKENGFIASHRFPMFIPKDNRVDLRFLTIFFLTKRGKYLLGLASPGGAGRNKTLGKSNFDELKVTFPTLEEQVKIADFYEALDKKLKLVEKQIEETQTFKKGLLQQMFV